MCRAWIALLLGLTLALPGLAAASSGGDVPPSTAWGEIDKLISEDKLEEVLPWVEELLGAARAAGDQETWTRALVQAAWLRERLRSSEDAAGFLHGQPRPSAPLYRAVVDLYYAEALLHDLRVSWQIRQREKVESEGEIPLEQWTWDQIAAAALAAGRDAWSLRREVGDAPLSTIHRYLQPGSYPAAVRGTVRDLISYLYAELLGNTTLWPPDDSAAVDSLDLPALIRGDATPAGTPAAHPLQEMAAVLGDLEARHLGAGRREAALEARRARLVRLHAAFSEEEDRRLIRHDLQEHLDSFRDVPWWSMGMATLAEMLKQEEPGRFARAHAAAVAGRDAWPGSPGGERCRAIAGEIEQPVFQLRSMESDGIGRRSLQVSHKEVPVLYFRAYPADLLEMDARYGAGPSDEAVRALIRDGRPVAAWRSELPATPDFESHVTWIVPPIDRPGAYVLVASSVEDFARPEGRLAAVRLVLTDLVLLSRDAGRQSVEVLALSGATGEPLAGAEVRLYQTGGTKVLGTGTTGADGALRLPVEPNQGYRVLGSSGGGPAQLGNLGTSSPGPPAPVSVLVYTDRAVYRPLQTVFWKVLAYRGSDGEGPPGALAGETMTVTLRDASSKEVASRTVTTNGFGTASGEFQIPSGRLLGGWSLRTSRASQPAGNELGSAWLQVEEYKRPTFEVVLDDPAAPLRPGAPAKLTGRAVYYFGLPVTHGQARWRVTRTPVYPWWQREHGYSGGRTVAAGTSAPDADGEIEIAFTPQPEGQDRGELTYEYSVSLEVTDEGGETRDADRSFRAGRAAVEGWIAGDRGFLLAGRPSGLTILRRDLNGVPRPGAASWALYELRQPERPLLPGEEPVPAPSSTSGEAPFRTPGDALAPRWGELATPELTLRGWPEGRRLTGGRLRHGTDGGAEVRLPALPPGAYRLVWETLDARGERVEARRDLIVAGRWTPLALPAVLKVESATVRVGGTARLLVHSGFPGQSFYFEVWRGGALLERRRLRGGEPTSLIERPIGPADRGGLSFKLLLLRDHQLCDLTESVQVPWDDRELRVELGTFRDRLRPGARETWKVTVRPPAGEAPETAAAEVLAAMTDRSLELFARHENPDPLQLYPDRTQVPWVAASLGAANEIWSAWKASVAAPPEPEGNRLLFPSFSRGRMRAEPMTLLDGMVEETIVVTAEAPQLDERRISTAATVRQLENIPTARDPREVLGRAPGVPPPPGVPPRSNFAETAFWRPHLLTGRDGTATIEFTVPDSVTAWDVFVQAVTRDLRAGTVRKEVRTARDLLVRPYLPRFLREGDRARLKVVVTNARKTPMRGEVALDVTDPETGRSLLADFGLDRGAARLPFTAPAGGGTSVVFPLAAPRRVGPVAFKVTAVAGDESDGELRPLPVLPSRVHLIQSRFVALRGAGRREMRFPDLERNGDPARIDERMVVTVDGQLFQGVLAALPYLVDYPYECAEQTLNRFVSTGIVTRLFDRYPAMARLAADLAKRETRLETWDATDPNRKLALEETPFLEAARGGGEKDLLKVLDPRIARAQHDDSLAKLTRVQLPSGAFPWWPGGPASPYMTAYILQGLARAAEFGAEVPREVVRKGWSYLAAQYHQEHGTRPAESCCLAIPVLLNYAASAYPDPSWMGNALTEAERREILETSFQHWTELSPYLRSLLALTLKRMGRPDDARLVFDSVLDRARTTPDE
ncbi:MAG: alpha-2-macroglobulin family protein, partial [Thermoanaerobaculia bacterium]